MSFLTFYLISSTMLIVMTYILCSNLSMLIFNRLSMIYKAIFDRSMTDFISYDDVNNFSVIFYFFIPIFRWILFILICTVAFVSNETFEKLIKKMKERANHE